MTKLVVLAILSLASAVSAVAQGDRQLYENDRRYCASGRSGVDFDSCMWRIQRDRERAARREYYEPPQPQYQEPPPAYGRPYEPPPPAYGRQWEEPRERPRLSDMQERALANCALLAPRDQPRCRATVMSTVR